MNKKKQQIIINIFVICLYFLWPYTLSGIINLFNLSEMSMLYISFSINFIFLFVVIYIYKNRLKKYIKNLDNKFTKKLLCSLKIFFVCLVLFGFLNFLLRDILKLPEPNTINSMTVLFKKIPIFFVLNTLFYYPIIEELIFKMSFKDIFKNKWFFVIITGIFNALFQIVFSMNFVTDIVFILPYAVFISGFSYIYYKTDNIIYPIFLRMCYNLIPCIIYMVDLLQ